VVSEQSARPGRAVVAGSETGARALGRAYWLVIRHASRGLLRPRERDGGVEIRLVGGPALFRFGRPEIRLDDEGVACRYPVRGGLLVRRPGGALTLAQAASPPVELRASVDGFFPRLAAGPGRPRWAGLAYDLQHRAHVGVSRRWILHLMAVAGP
jgi:hypothetical protein